MADLQARIDVLVAELEEAKARISELESLLGFDFVPPLCLGLSPTQGRLLGGLMKRSLLTRAGAMAAMYDQSVRDLPDPKIVDVFICKLRPKLLPFGISIETVWGTGWSLSPDSKARVKALGAQVAA